jgi:rSAM/selenodomain-associated transferase 2
MKISIIIPVLNEEKALPATLHNVAECAPDCEVIVVDGGSQDRTREIAQAFEPVPVVWVESARGRGRQMNVGAARATGDALLFLHADTHLPPHTPALIARALSDPRVPGGNFRLQFVPRTLLTDLFSWCYNLRSRFRVFYGDSGIFVRREIFEQMGGYRAERILEDYEFVKRLRRVGRLITIREGTIRSSARRFATLRASVKTLGVWALLHLLVLLDVPRERLERYYPEVR